MNRSVSMKLLLIHMSCLVQRVYQYRSMLPLTFSRWSGNRSMPLMYTRPFPAVWQYFWIETNWSATDARASPLLVSSCKLSPWKLLSNEGLCVVPLPSALHWQGKQDNESYELLTIRDVWEMPIIIPSPIVGISHDDHVRTQIPQSCCLNKVSKTNRDWSCNNDICEAWKT